MINRCSSGYSAPALWPSPSAAHCACSAVSAWWRICAHCLCPLCQLHGLCLATNAQPLPGLRPPQLCPQHRLCSHGQVAGGGSLSSLDVGVAISPSADKGLTQLGRLRYVTDKQTNRYGRLGPAQTVDLDYLCIYRLYRSEQSEPKLYNIIS